MVNHFLFCNTRYFFCAAFTVAIFGNFFAAIFALKNSFTAESSSSICPRYFFRRFTFSLEFSLNKNNQYIFIFFTYLQLITSSVINFLTSIYDVQLPLELRNPHSLDPYGRQFRSCLMFNLQNYR